MASTELTQWTSSPRQNRCVHILFCQKSKIGPAMFSSSSHFSSSFFFFYGSAYCTEEQSFLRLMISVVDRIISKYFEVLFQHKKFSVPFSSIQFIYVISRDFTKKKEVNSLQAQIYSHLS